MTKTYAPLSASDGNSLCYRCRYYDWAIVFGEKDAHAWQHQCDSALECVPGDYVTECEGFKDEH